MMRRTAWAVVAAMTVSLGVASADETLPQRAYLPLAKAQTAAQAALEACAKDGYRVSVAIVGRQGVTRVQLNADGAGPHTLSSSSRKAFTAASLGRPTAEFSQLIADKPALAGLEDMHERILMLAGGLPIRIDGELLGGIGVGGAPGGELDVACAQAGLAAIDAERDASE